MSIKPIPLKPSLEFYRKQAKALLKAVRSGDFARVQILTSAFASDEEFHLSDAQWVIAREHGFSSWPKFKSHIEDAIAASESTARDGIGATSDSKEISMNDTIAATDITIPAIPLPPGALTPPLPPVAPPAPTAPEPPGKASLPIGDDAVRAKTGKGWDQWFETFDAAGGASMTHQEIVAIAKENGAGSWWQQMVTVAYEQARGKRVPNQSCNGRYQVNINKTIHAPAADVFEAWINPERRKQWLPDAPLTIRKATSSKSLRITWSDSENVDVNLVAKGDSKSGCAVEHSKFPDAEGVHRYRVYWSAALDRLKALLE